MLFSNPYYFLFHNAMLHVTECKKQQQGSSDARGCDHDAPIPENNGDLIKAQAQFFSPVLQLVFGLYELGLRVCLCTAASFCEVDERYFTAFRFFEHLNGG